MRYIGFTYVDAKTREPLTAAPAKNGPDIPDGLTPVFHIEQTFGAAPSVYGVAADDFEPEPWMIEVDEAVFINTFKDELKWRCNNRREAVISGGVSVGGIIFKTDTESQSRIGNVVLGLIMDPNITEIPRFKAASGWVTLTRDSAIDAGNAVFAHVQRCFEWCGSMHDRIDAELIDAQSGLALAGEIQLFS